MQGIIFNHKNVKKLVLKCKIITKMNDQNLIKIINNKELLFY